MISIQEIKLNQEQANLFLRFDGYSTHFHPRKNNAGFGGGMTLIVKESISHTVIAGLEKELEHIGVRIETNDLCFNIISLYSPSNTLKVDTFKKYGKYDLLVVGDFNSKTPTLGCRSLKSDKNGKILEEILSFKSDLCVLNDESSTYFKFNSVYEELLDLFICSSKLANIAYHFEVLIT